MSSLKILVGWDRKEPLTTDVAAASIIANAKKSDVEITYLIRQQLEDIGLFRRPRKVDRDGQQWDIISNAPVSTDFAFTRFLVPHLCDRKGWALFCDGDMYFTRDPKDLFDLADDRYAVMVVKHAHIPTESEKKRGQAQTKYFRKNWSSVVLWN